MSGIREAMFTLPDRSYNMERGKQNKLFSAVLAVEVSV
jgi:hypothetical protein